MDDLRSELKRVGLAPEKKKPKKRSERLSERDWKELMGMNRPTYKRYKGAYRQK